MRLLRWLYPLLVGLLMGLLQTGLYFQLSFTLSSSFRTFLMVTVCWLIGSVAGIRIAQKMSIHLNVFLLLALLAYFACAVLLGAQPFNTHLWPLYALLIALIGAYPGQFFVGMSRIYSARALFFIENNGFILGLIAGTILFLLLGRLALWVVPLLVAAVVMLCTRRLGLPWYPANAAAPETPGRPQ